MKPRGPMVSERHHADSIHMGSFLGRRERGENGREHTTASWEERETEKQRKRNKEAERHREAETQKERKMSRTWGEEKRSKGEEVGGALPFKERDMAHVHRDHTVDQSIVCVLGMRAG